MRLRFPKDEFLRLMEELRTTYKQISGEEISYDEILEVLEGRRLIFPVTEKMAKLLEELSHIYHIAPWEAKRWVKGPSRRDKS